MLTHLFHPLRISCRCASSNQKTTSVCGMCHRCLLICGLPASEWRQTSQPVLQTGNQAVDLPHWTPHQKSKLCNCPSPLALFETFLPRSLGQKWHYNTIVLHLELFDQFKKQLIAPPKRSCYILKFFVKVFKKSARILLNIVKHFYNFYKCIGKTPHTAKLRTLHNSKNTRVHTHAHALVVLQSLCG